MSRPPRSRVSLALRALAATVGLGATSEGAGPVDFNRDVRPILAKNCLACHGRDEAHRGAGLRLDVRDGAVAELESGSRAVAPGAPDESEILARVAEEDDSLRMPPRKAGPRLSGGEVAVLRRWVEAGAPYAKPWSLVAPEARPTPAVRRAAWPRNGVDAWVLARLEAEGLEPAPEADEPSLLRRASLDLRGLPPTPAEVDAFAGDGAPGAYERAVDRFLADPAFGERWARPWLDLARYADSAGYGSDPLRTIWRYRDWVIDALNANQPYDRFTTDQLAGDLLPAPTPAQRAATAFHRNTMTNTEGGTDDEEFRVAAVKDRVDTTGQVWLGLTLGCAKCHDHKFDPVSQEDYYKLFGVFNQTADADRPDERPTIPAPTPDQAREAREFDARLAALKTWLGVSTPDAPGLALAAAEAARREKAKGVATLPVMAELPAGERRETRVLNKGNFLDPGAKVRPGFPPAVLPFPESGPADRLALARWLVDPANPLTARVAVNRLWGQLFGVGIVETEDDFGTQGEPPSHPELLDWLAVRFVESGWDVKGLLRTIVTSSSYRQSSKVTRERLEKDPRNRLVSRGPRFRLDAETVRDQALALSGLLGRKVGGPSVFPAQPEGLWQAAFNGQRTWATSPGTDRHRRGLYTFWRRTVPYPSMAAFDAPSRELCTARRTRTNTPLQAFVTLNDPVYVEASQALGRRIAAEGGASPEGRVSYGLRLCLGRTPSPSQVEALLKLYRSEKAHYDGDRASAVALATDPLGPLPDGSDPAELAAWTTVANVLLNLDAVLTKG